MIDPLEAVGNLLRPVVMQALLARERLESGVAYNPVSDEVARDPYAVYRRLRDRDPVHRMRLVDAWVLTRYEHVDAMLRDHDRFGAEDRRFHDTGLTTMLDIDPPDHTRLRSLVSRAFAPRSVSHWEGRVQEIADRLLGRGLRPRSHRPDRRTRLSGAVRLAPFPVEVGSGVSMECAVDLHVPPPAGL